LELEQDAGSSPKGAPAFAQSESPAAGPQSTVRLVAQERCSEQKQEAVRRRRRPSSSREAKRGCRQLPLKCSPGRPQVSDLIDADGARVSESATQTCGRQDKPQRGVRSAATSETSGSMADLRRSHTRDVLSAEVADHTLVVLSRRLLLSPVCGLEIHEPRRKSEHGSSTRLSRS